MMRRVLNFFSKGDKMQLGAKHILVDQMYEAEDIIKKINSGSSFESLAKDFSKCPSGKDGGDLGKFGKGMMVKSFEDAVLNLEVDKISTPVKTQFGYHLIKRTF